MRLRFTIARKAYQCDECRQAIRPGTECVAFQWNGELRRVHANEFCEFTHPALENNGEPAVARGAK